MAPIILCPDFEYFIRLPPALRRAIEFASKHGNSAYTLMEAVGGEAGQSAASEFLDALWTTNPDRNEVIMAIDKMLEILYSASDVSRYATTSSRLESREIAAGLRWLGARLEELRHALT